MNTQQAAALLGIAAAFDNRKPDPDSATAWALALSGYRFEDCRDAIVAHYRQTSDWLMPNHVIAGVKKIRHERITNYGPIEPPADLDPANVEKYARWQSTTLRAIGDGELVKAEPQQEPRIESHRDRERRQAIADLADSKALPK